MEKRSQVAQMAIDILDGNPDTYDLNTAEDKLRKLVLNEMGGTWDYYTFQDNKYKVFAILSEILTESTSRVLREVFEPFCEFRDFELGDTVEFTVEDDRLFEVSVVATDNNNLLRQKLMNRKVPMTASELGVKIYAPFTAWLAGRISLEKLVDRVQKSVQQDMVRRIGNAFVSAYGQCHANLVESGTVTRDALSLLCAKVDGLGLGDPVIYGTKTALAKIPALEGFVLDGEDLRNNGYLKMFEGMKCVELKNTFNKETGKFGLGDDEHLYIVPSGMTKPIMVGFEGKAFVLEDKTGARNDREVEYLFTRRVHIGVVKAVNFGRYDIA